MVQSAKQELKPNQETFCRYYVESRNATQSYKKAYAKNKLSNSVCAVNGCKLLRATKIQKRIEALSVKVVLDCHIKPIMILNEYADLAFSNLADMVDEDYNLKPLKKLTAGQKKSIKKLKKTSTKRYNKEGEVIGSVEIVEVELFDRTRALDALAQFTGVLEPEKITQILMQVNNQTTNTLIVNPDDLSVEALEKMLTAQEKKEEENVTIEMDEDDD